jgi:hypothetical protein
LQRGNPGNVGGPGRPPSLIRQLAREKLHDRVPILADIADNASAADIDRIRAISTLGVIGLGGHVSLADVRDRLKRTLETLHRELPAEHAERAIQAIRHIWRSGE